MISLTMMFDAMTPGSSHTDSIKKIWEQKGPIVESRRIVEDIVLDPSGRHSNTYLEVILAAKLEDHVSPFSCCVRGIEDLKKRTRQRCQTFGFSFGQNKMHNGKLTATWPPSSFK